MVSSLLSPLCLLDDFNTQQVVHIQGLTVHSKHSSMQDLQDIQSFAVEFKVRACTL